MTKEELDAHEKRWRVLSKLDFDEAPGFVVVRVRTPKGTGKTAYGLSLLAAELADNRKWIAHAVRKARTAASTFRAKAEPERRLAHIRAAYRRIEWTAKGRMTRPSRQRWLCTVNALGITEARAKQLLQDITHAFRDVGY